MDTFTLSPANFYQHLTNFLPRQWQRDCGNFRPTQVLYSVMAVVTRQSHGAKRVIDELKRTVGSALEWDSCPAASSFSEARRKLTPDMCHEAFTALRKCCTTIPSHPRVRYGKYNLVAVDRTCLALPGYADISETFGHATYGKGKQKKAATPQASLTMLWNISTNSPVAWELGRVYASERFAAHNLLEQLGENDLLLADRGYPSHRYFHDLTNRGSSYLIRVPVQTQGGFKQVRDFARNNFAWDKEIELISEKAPPLKVRLIKVRLPSGENAVFATNLLNKKLHARKALGALYCYRWDIETAFREMKVWHGLENITARYADGIHQEVTALMIFMLLTAELEAQAFAHHKVTMAVSSRENTPAKPTIRFNRRYLCDCVWYLMAAACEGPRKLAEMYAYAMSQLWRHRQEIRPNRSYERRAKSPNSKWKLTTRNTKKKKVKLAE